MPELVKFILINISTTILWLILPFSIQIFVDKVVISMWGFPPLNYLGILVIFLILASGIAIGCERILARFASRLVSSGNSLRRLLLYANFSRLLPLFLILFYANLNFGLFCIIFTALAGAILWKLNRKINFEILLRPSSRKIFVSSIVSIGFLLLTDVFAFLLTLVTGSMGFNLFSFLYISSFACIAVIIFSAVFWLLRERISCGVGTRVALNGTLTLLILFARVSFESLLGIFLGILIVLAYIAFIFINRQTLSRSELELAVNRLVTFLPFVVITIFEFIKAWYGASLVVQGGLSLGELFSLSLINLLIVETMVSIIAIFHNSSSLSSHFLADT
jgi:hypothetical protein